MYIADVALVDVAVGDVTVDNEAAQHGGAEGIVLVVVDTAHALPLHAQPRPPKKSA